MTNSQERINQIAFQLGLEPPASYRPPAHAALKNRASGRTTRMILWALSDVLLGSSVCFMAPTREQAAEILYTAREYARKLGLDPSKIRRPVAYGVTNNPALWPPGVKVYRDHTLNHSGGHVSEPQTAVTRGPLAGHTDYKVTCPWCRRAENIHLSPADAVTEGTTEKFDCSGCNQPILLHVARVQITLKTWRDDA